MIKNLLIYSISIFFLQFVACNGSKKSQVDQPAKADKIEAEAVDVTIKKGNCFGRCPVFELDINAQGQMEYRGKLFVDRTGTWKGQLPADQLSEIHQMIAMANIAELEEEYFSGATDFPVHVLEVSLKTGRKSIRGDMKLPKKIKALIHHIDSVSNAASWRQYTAPIPREAVPGEILVRLKEDDLSPVITAFSDDGLTVKNRIAPNMAMYVLQYPKDHKDAGRLLVRIREHSNVEMAQFNQNVSNRN